MRTLSLPFFVKTWYDGVMAKPVAKMCSGCHVIRIIDDFYDHPNGRFKKRSKCRHCGLAQMKANPKTREIQKRLRRERIDWINSLKESSPCMDCGVSYPYFVMQYDHVNGKEYAISRAVLKYTNKETIMQEINKCELVCSNCHAFRTHSRRKIGTASR